jgi:hypothetical protein
VHVRREAGGRVHAEQARADPEASPLTPGAPITRRAGL